jgi:hypothetical protein
MAMETSQRKAKKPDMSQYITRVVPERSDTIARGEKFSPIKKRWLFLGKDTTQLPKY